MRIFITGDEGKLGSRIAALLRDKGHEIVGWDVVRDKREDIRDLDALIPAVKGCDMVIHCAAIPHPKKGSFGKYFNINVQGTAYVMEAADRARVQRVIYLSSTGFYGCDLRGRLMPAYFPIDEAHPIASQPGRSWGKLDVYNQSKVMAEQIVAWYGTNRCFEAVVLRCAPANPKSWQYRGTPWQQYNDDYRETGDNWTRGCFFSNCHPDYVAQAAALAVEAEGPFWYEPFNITDRYAGLIDTREFLDKEYPGIEVRADLGPHDSLITPAKAMRVLGFQPCEDMA